MKFAFLPVVLVSFVLSGCQEILSFDSAESVKTLTEQVKNADSSDDLKNIAKQAQVSHDLIRADIKLIKAKYAELDAKVKSKWGDDNSALPTKTQYVKYTNDYQARTLVDFEQGWVRVETLDASSPIVALKDAVTTTLLTTADPSKTDIFSSSAPNTEGVPFLYPQVLDHEGTLVRYRWRAERYAEHLVNNQLKKSTEDGKEVYTVQFNLVEQHQHLRQEKYSDFVIASANKYNLDPALIYGIIQTESSFNPYAVSFANAYGLMQVVPATAGKDVYNLVKKRSDEPTKETLFIPEQNIDIGSAYLHILQTRYLVKVTNKTSQEYAMISAYNGGTGNVLKAFNSDRTKAMTEINQSSSSTVYNALRNDHPLSESRKYLEKVTTAKKSYQ
ncbi:murein transglycosylase domain-containing protein [Marinomonas sp.]|nr:murein transglycosylase domain-containing protein [Marinomonas sp.]MDB4838190.1 murein transglycosylase domain-containing protein [Marinomonas sp.]